MHNINANGIKQAVLNSNSEELFNLDDSIIVPAHNSLKTVETVCQQMKGSFIKES
jgi:hypothetical protein